MHHSCPRAAKAAQTSAFAAPSPLAIPHKGRGLLIPACHRLLEPVDHLLSVFWMLARECSAHDDALHRFGQYSRQEPESGV